MPCGPRRSCRPEFGAPRPGGRAGNQGLIKDTRWSRIFRNVAAASGLPPAVCCSRMKSLGCRPTRMALRSSSRRHGASRREISVKDWTDGRLILCPRYFADSACELSASRAGGACLSQSSGGLHNVALVAL
jgi:hypothetical protein